MECSSFLYCKSGNETLVKLLNTLNRETINSFKDEEHEELFQSGLDAYMVAKYLKEYDTDFEITFKDDQIEIETFPLDFPEKLYEFLMPWLAKIGAENIYADDHTASGSRRVEYDLKRLKLVRKKIKK